MQNTRHWVASSLLAIAIVHALPKAHSQEVSQKVVSFDLPAQPLADALIAIGRISGQQIIFPGEMMAGQSAPVIQGRFSSIGAVKRALSGSGFILEQRADAIFIFSASGAGSSSRDESVLVVTGSRIRGAAAASPIYTYEIAKARDEGINDMRGLAAAIPQNFTGGQNPGVGNGAESSGSTNVDSSTALNLRGLGPGSTLTLLNGHRLAYNLSNQSVDFSSIPFAAVDRVEIMPDGASAIYGSDAIGGVANIILKRDFGGVSANAVVGAATDGGYVTQSYNLVGGAKWASGGVVLTGNFDSSTSIVAGDRSFASTTNPYLTLYPELETHAFVGSVHQDITPDLTLAMDALYSSRTAGRETPYTANGPVQVSGFLTSYESRNLNVAPSATLKLGSWSLSMVTSYGRSHMTSRQTIFPSSRRVVELENENISAETSGEGPLFRVPAGEVRLALGAGYRRDRFIYPLVTSPIDAHQDNYSAYAEINLPITAPDQGLAGLYRTSLSAAVRYEKYPGMGKLATPKIGFIWSPMADADLKFNWGKSFRAPTLFQRLNPTQVNLFPGDLYGSRQAPADQTIIALYGGDRGLKPEKATSLSASLLLHPRAIPNLDLSFSYYNVKYRDRIVAPVASMSRALIDPIFADFVSFSPSGTDIASAIALSPFGLDDQTGYGTPFDPASVYAIVDARSRNVAKDVVEGIDISAQYRLETSSLGNFTLHGNATYLRSSRVLIDGLPEIILAGTLYNPSRFKTRGGVAWSSGSVMVNAIVNYVGGVTDNRRSEHVDVRGMTSFDLSAKLHIGRRSDGLDVQISALNLLNAKPALIRAAGINSTYDSTNYSAIGRYLSLSLTKGF